MRLFTFNTTPSIVFEPGSSHRLGAIFDSLPGPSIEQFQQKCERFCARELRQNKAIEHVNDQEKNGRALVFITDPGLCSLKLCDPALSSLKAQTIKMSLFDAVEADPSRITLEKAVETGRAAVAAGVVGMGGGSFHVPHGLSTALVLPHVLRFNAPQAAPLYAELAAGAFPHLVDVKKNEDRCDPFIDALADLTRRPGLKTRLRDVAKNAWHLLAMAADAMKQTRLLVNNPSEVGEADALAICQAAL